MRRFLDITLAISGLTIGSPLLAAITAAGYLDTGSPIFRQTRVGRHQKPFTLIKFRTMKTDTKSVATHLADASSITRLGNFLRSSKLDELPQLWNVLKGDMSLVGPRPCLPSQEQLIEARDALGVFESRPGITGLAQILGIDMSTPEKLSEIDAEMLEKLTVREYFLYIIQTALGKGSGDRIQR